MTVCQDVPLCDYEVFSPQQYVAMLESRVVLFPVLTAACVVVFKRIRNGLKSSMVLSTLLSSLYPICTICIVSTFSIYIFVFPPVVVPCILFKLFSIFTIYSTSH